MRELATSYRSLPLLTRVVVGGAFVIAAIVLLVNVPNILTAILVVGLALLAIGLVLAFLGLCSLPFVGLGLALYGLVKALRPPSQPPGWAPAAPAVGQGSRSTRAVGRSELEPPAGLPAEIAAEEARLRDKAAALRSPGQSVFLTAEDQQHIDKTLNEYLPNCLATYQGLPSGSADWPAGPKGETASQLVERQLRLLEESLDRIGQRVFQAGAAQLVAQQRFLEERFRPRAPADLEL
jgi:hypothetical protein